VDFYRLTNVLPAIPESRFHIKNKWFEAWPRWNYWLILTEAPASAYWTSPSKTRFYNMLGKEDQSRKRLSQPSAWVFGRQTQRARNRIWPIDLSGM
jgi:hypothetical protein